MCTQPARIRKRNPLFFDDNVVVNPPVNKSPRKSNKAASQSQSSQASQSAQSAVKMAKKGTVRLFCLILKKLLNPCVNFCRFRGKGASRSAPSSATATPERRTGSTSSTPMKNSATKLKAKLKKVKVRPQFKVDKHL